jgi:hypothetical protein
MKRILNTAAISVLTCAVLACAAKAFAHHSFAMFDQTQKLTFKGTVKEFQWTNPHAFIHLEVANANGGHDEWEVELNSPNNLKRQGWKSTILQPGEQITLILNPLRDLTGKKGGLFVALTKADGTVLGEPDRGVINVPTAR